MKYIGVIWLFFSLLLSGVSGHCAATVSDGCEKKGDAFGQAEETPVFYGTEQQAGRFHSLFRMQLTQFRKSVTLRIVTGMKRILRFTSLRETALTQQQCTLFNRHFLFSDKSCTLHYVYAMRHILI